MTCIQNNHQTCIHHLLQRILPLLLLLFFFCTKFTLTHSANSIKRRSNRPTNNNSQGATRYDRSITLFNDDGRLLQVDYAMECTRRGLPVLCMTVSNVTFLVLLRSKSESGTSRVHRVDHGVILVTTGLVGDGRALAQATRVACQRMRMDHGEVWSPTMVSDVAMEVAGIQHELTRTPGARPLGITATILGCNNCDDRDCMELFQSEPGGVLQNFTRRYCVAGRDQEKYRHVMENIWMATYSRIDDDKHDNVDMDSVLESMVNAVLKHENLDADKENDISMDIWTMTRDAERRGGVRIRCAKDISNIGGFQQVKDRLLH